MRVTIERQPVPPPFTGTMPKVRKELFKCSFDELKEAYRLAMLEKMEYHPESAFQSLVDEEMRAITEQLKRRKK
jgi:hypothetical protein